MTKTLTTDRLKQIASSDAFICTQDDESVAIARELLANREAQPVAEYGDAYQGAREDLSIWKRRALEAEDKVRHLERVNDHLVKEVQGEHRFGEPIITAPPSPAVPTPVNFSENADADMCRKWAWEQVKEVVSTDGWTLGDNITYFGFFCWGWDMRRQYNEQRPPVVNPEFTGATAVPDERAAFNAWNNEDNLPIAGIPAKNAAWLAWQARAMLAQPVSQGCKLVPVEPTSQVIAPFIKHCCENEAWVRQAWREMLAAAPEGGN